MEKVLRYIEIGKDEGAKVACGGKRIMEDGIGDGFLLNQQSLSM